MTALYEEPLNWFSSMVAHNLDFVKSEKSRGKKLVGIMCEYTPRELIMAADALAVSLCGGSAEMIPAAEQFLPANLCPLIKSTFGFSIEESNPFLEMADLIVAETTCDGKKKMFELLSERHTMEVLELPQKPDDPDAFQHWLSELNKLKDALEKHFKINISDDKLRSAIKEMNKERDLKRRLASLMKADNPPLTGRELLNLKGLIACVPGDLVQYEKALNTLPGRVLDPPGNTRIRVLLTGVPLPHGAERVMDIIETQNALVVCQENCTGLKPILDDVDEMSDDPIRAIAEKYYHIP
ncbi:hypothetical protein BVY01_04890, partial [bacterium I07]